MPLGKWAHRLQRHRLDASVNGAAAIASLGRPSQVSCHTKQR
jgi:hypothetical protein